MRLKITIGLAALAIGTALASVPAVAEPGISGYASDGRVIAVHPYRNRARPLYNFAPQHEQRNTPSGLAPGRKQNDGGKLN
jgi:hypothetical protein